LAIKNYSPYVIIGYSRPYYHKIFVAILLMVILLVPIGDYFIGGYWWLLVVMNGYFIGGY
jgi:hypothetical protein